MKQVGRCLRYTFDCAALKSIDQRLDVLENPNGQLRFQRPHDFMFLYVDPLWSPVVCMLACDLR